MNLRFSQGIALIISGACTLLFACKVPGPQSIDRQALVERHNVINTGFDTLASLTVGNGSFAFTVDATGLQSFPDAYARGVPLGTQSEWGWHSFPNVHNYTEAETLREYTLNGRKVTYAVQVKTPDRNKQASDYFRINQHRLQLGNLGFEIIKKDGTPASMNDIKDIKQELKPWSGEIHSSFTVEGEPVEVSTYCNQQQDAVSIQVNSALLKEKRIMVRLRFPYPTGGWSDAGNYWKDENKHQSAVILQEGNHALLSHTLDTTTYFVSLKSDNDLMIAEKTRHYFLITPAVSGRFELTCRFEPDKNEAPVPSFTDTRNNSGQLWEAFWKNGGAVDFSGSTDERAFELERRVVLSQYLLRAQEAGGNPPQETGLTYNSWYGKPHMEMHYWHSMQYALWGRTELLEKSMDWYNRAADKGREIARRQGYDGIRWQKMTGNDGREVPSSVGAFLIWQQPHFIYFSELCYRTHKDKQTLDKYKDLVFATADFMASFPYYDTVLQRYILGKGVIPAQERFKAEETFNPTYELVYWQWALKTAQQWRERLNMPRNEKWDEVLQKLSPLPVQDDKYLFTESGTDSYTNPEYRTDHPSVFGAFGMMPQTGMVDTAIMRNTFDWIWNNWSWKDTWGWDFPMTAMTATRLGLPEKAVESLLMNITTNTYLPNGHNYQNDRLRLYLPGNGGLLAAVAMMCAGFDNGADLPGIPKDGSWKVRWEGLHKMP